MLFKITFILPFLLITFIKASENQTNIWLITNIKTKVNSISKRDLKALFLMQKSKITQFNLSILEYRFDSKVRNHFSKKYLNMNKQQLQKYWMTRFVNIGQNEPVSKKNYKVIEYNLRKKVNIISYCFIQKSLHPKLKRVIITP
ncbi:MAG: hypothetical protein COB02_11605 [Candidatus Cloacimonadota bacterium]|nr:MAG: hypothetical protein COB02_11605 [Candidatus Cloacimonadota bacterium]